VRSRTVRRPQQVDLGTGVQVFVGNPSMSEGQRKKPTHIAFAVRNFQNEAKQQPDANWSRIGVAWMHRDGKAFDVVLEAVPVNGRVVLRLNVPKPKRRGIAPRPCFSRRNRCAIFGATGPPLCG
jgi:hypothetical protein